MHRGDSRRLGTAEVVACLIGLLGACGRRNFNDLDAPGGETPTGAANLMFVTATVHTGNLGGLAGADAVCNDAAAAAGIPGTYVAWLSTTTVAAASRLTGARGWVRTDGEIVMDRPTELTSQGPRVPLSVTEDGVDLRGVAGNVSAYTGSSGQGQASQRTCADWTDPAVPGDVGSAVSGGGEFAAIQGTANTQPCASTHHLYCFGIDRVAVLGDSPPPPAPRAFRSRGMFSPSTTRSAADALCATEAADAGLAGVFLAALPLAGETTASRFTPGRVYHRTDGVRLGRILSEPMPHTFLNRHADGRLAPPSAVWTAGSPTRTVGVQATCDSWSASTNMGDVGSSAVATAAMFVNLSFQSCAFSWPVYCLEE